MTWFLVIAFLFTLDINQVWFLKLHIYILGVFTENPCSKSLERNYSQLSLSRLRLSRITAYLEEKILSLF